MRSAWPRRRRCSNRWRITRFGVFYIRTGPTPDPGLVKSLQVSGRCTGRQLPRRLRIVRALPLLQVRDYRVYFPIRQGVLKRTIGYVKAVDGISFNLAAGRTLALVGESGCGKTTTGKALLQLLRDSRSHRRRSQARRPAARSLGRRRAASGATQDADHFPGSVFVVESAHARLGDSRRRHRRTAARRSTPRSDARKSRRCWKRSGCAPTRRSDTRMSSQEDSVSGLRSLARSRSNRG